MIRLIVNSRKYDIGIVETKEEEATIATKRNGDNN